MSEVRTVDEKVYCKNYDKYAKYNIAGSQIWKDTLYHESDSKQGVLFEYSVRFKGTKPIQLLGIKKVTFNEKGHEVKREAFPPTPKEERKGKPVSKDRSRKEKAEKDKKRS